MNHEADLFRGLRGVYRVFGKSAYRNALQQARVAIARAALRESVARNVTYLDKAMRFGRDGRTDIARIVEQQPVVFFSDADGKSRKHVFDFLATCHDGRRIAIAVKPKVIADRIGMKDLVQLIATQMPRSFADAACLVTDADIDPIALRNAELMHACRFGDPADDEIVIAVARSYGGAVTLQDLIAAARIQGRGYRSAMRLLAAGRLRTLRHEIFCDQTLIAHTEAPR